MDTTGHEVVFTLENYAVCFAVQDFKSDSSLLLDRASLLELISCTPGFTGGQPYLSDKTEFLFYQSLSPEKPIFIAPVYLNLFKQLGSNFLLYQLLSNSRLANQINTTLSDRGFSMRAHEFLAANDTWLFVLILTAPTKR